MGTANLPIPGLIKRPGGGALGRTPLGATHTLMPNLPAQHKCEKPRMVRGSSHLGLSNEGIRNPLQPCAVGEHRKPHTTHRLRRSPTNRVRALTRHRTSGLRYSYPSPHLSSITRGIVRAPQHVHHRRRPNHLSSMPSAEQAYRATVPGTGDVRHGVLSFPRRPVHWTEVSPRPWSLCTGQDHPRAGDPTDPGGTQGAHARTCTPSNHRNGHQANHTPTNPARSRSAQVISPA